MTHLQGLIRFSLFLLLWTAIGQIRWNQRSIEDRYHTAVNSRSFQKLFWTTAKPITWTSEKLQDLWEETPVLNKIPAR
ncbi:MAG: hypothetical protein KA116_11635 [Proteobacteria bacterium]|jgi:hypothetical protein|nr:hypothetical protein [Pseudomonadota bacterium]